MTHREHGTETGPITLRRGARGHLLAHQVLAGALVADAVMDIYDIEELEICPWALREGIILERLDQMSVLFRG